MIGKVLKKVLKAAVAQPWEYMGEGAPDEWEFRVSPDGQTAAFYNPEFGYWKIFQTVELTATATQAEMDRHTADWGRYVEELEDE